MCQCVYNRNNYDSIKEKTFSGYMVAGCFVKEIKQQIDLREISLTSNFLSYLERSKRKNRRYPRAQKLMELTFSPSCHNPLGSAIHIKKKKSYIKEKADWQEKGNYWDCFWEKRGGGGKELGIAGFHWLPKKRNIKLS